MTIEKIKKDIPFQDLQLRDGEMHKTDLIRQPNLGDVIQKVDEIVDFLNKPSVLAEGWFSDGHEESTPATHLRNTVNGLMEELSAEILHGECFHNEKDFRDLMKTIDELRLKSTYLYMANGKDN